MRGIPFISVGWDNVVNTAKIKAIITSSGAQAHRILKTAKDTKTYLDMTVGHKARSLIIMDDGTIVGSGITSSTLMRRCNEGVDSDDT